MVAGATQIARRTIRGFDAFLVHVVFAAGRGERERRGDRGERCRLIALHRQDVVPAALFGEVGGGGVLSVGSVRGYHDVGEVDGVQQRRHLGDLACVLGYLNLGDHGFLGGE